MASLRLNRPYVAAVHDLVMAALSFVLALYLRLGDQLMNQAGGFIVEGTVLFTVICGVVFWRLRFYRCLWRYASLTDLWALVKGATIAILTFLLVFFLVTRLAGYPRSAAVINWFVLLALLGGPRFLYRLAKDRGLGGVVAGDGGERRIPVLLVGAGDAAEGFIRDLGRHRDAEYRVVGALDDRPALRHATIRGVRILGRLDEVAAVVAKLDRRGERPRRLILSERFEGEVVRRLLDAADAQGLALARLPRLTEFRDETDGGPGEPRPIAVEDILGRPQRVLDRAAMRALIGGRRVMITGAGGTIGGELARQIATFAPARLVLFDNAEFNLYRIDAELAEARPEVARAAVLGDVRDRSRVDVVLARERPELVFHAAAFKHVPMVEANPNEGVLTNIVGTRVVADACRAAGVATMVLISTDKAVNPTSVMGASKRAAELYCQALGAAGGVTRYVTVRFGNVLGSTGSVVPLFERQIAAGGPLTVTDPEMTRFFMTTREAVSLVLQAAATAGESGEIFVLEMGAPVRILDLARQMVRLAGLRPGADIEIVTTGARPGEKRHEELFYARETLDPAGDEGLIRARSEAHDLPGLVHLLNRVAEAAQARRTAETLALMRRLVPEYADLDDPARAATATG